MEQYQERLERLVQNFIQFSHFIKSQNRTKELKSGEMSIIRCLIHHTDGATPELKPSQISAMMGLGQPTITPLLRSLEEKGLIARRSGTKDRREVYISLTEMTYAKMATQRTKTAEMFQGLMDYLGEAQGEALMELMERVCDYMTEQRQNGGEECYHRTPPPEKEAALIK